MKNVLERIALRSELIYRGYSTETQLIYIREVERFLDWVNKEVVDILKSDLVRYLNSERETKDINTILVQLNALEFFFRECLGIDTADDITGFKREFKARQLPTEREVKELLGRVPERERVVILLIRDTGFLSKELVLLRIVDLEQRDKGYYLNNKEISIDTARELYNYIERSNNETKIFENDKSTLQRGIKASSMRYLNVEYSERDIKFGRGLEIIRREGEVKGAEYLGYSSIPDMRQYFRRIGYVYKK